MFKVDNDKCLRCGMCVATFTDVFDYTDDADITVNNDNVNEDNIEDIRDFAKNSCPGVAIKEIDKEDEKEKEDN